MNSGHYLLELGNLRKIGRALWHGSSHIDPVPPADDAFDSCLIQAAGLALRGEHEDDIFDYIVGCCAQMRIIIHDSAIAETVRALLAHIEDVRTRTP